MFCNIISCFKIQSTRHESASFGGRQSKCMLIGQELKKCMLKGQEPKDGFELLLLLSQLVADFVTAAMGLMVGGLVIQIRYLVTESN